MSVRLNETCAGCVNGRRPARCLSARVATRREIRAGLMTCAISPARYTSKISRVRESRRTPRPRACADERRTVSNPPFRNLRTLRDRVDERVGTVVADRYRLDAIIAMGGIGAVYRAEDRTSGAHVAVKILLPETEGFSILAARMEREGFIGKRLRHRNLVDVLDFGATEDGGRWIATELIEGCTLRDVMKQGPMAEARAIRIATQLLEALRACHARGVIHRDIKPRNVMIGDGPDDPLKLIDFGLALVPKQVIQSGWNTPDEDCDETSTQKQLTTNGIVFGTLAYMAPETALGMGAVTAQSDLYALGVILYELVAGRHPFEPTDPTELFLHHRIVPAPPLSVRAPDVRVSPGLEAIILRLLSKSPSDRPAHAAEVTAHLVELRITATTVPPPRESLGAVSSLQNATVMTVAPVAHTSVRPDGAPAEEARPSQEPRYRSRSTRLIGAVAPALALALALGVVAAASLRRVDTDRPRARAFDPSTTLRTASERTATIVVPPPPPDTRALDTFRAEVELENWTAAIAALQALLDADPMALSAAEDRERAVRVSLRAAYKEMEGVSELFDAFALRTGTDGLEVLYILVESQGGSRGAALAAERLGRRDVRARLTPELDIALALREASCREKPKLFERAGRQGDERALRVLELLRSSRCDARRGECCYPKNRALENAARLIGERRIDEASIEEHR